MLPSCNRGFRNPSLEKGQCWFCSRTTQRSEEEQGRAGRRSAGSRSLGILSRRSGGPAAVIRRRSKKFGLFFFVVAVVLGLATATGAFQGSPAHAQPVASLGVTISETSLEIEELNIVHLYTVVLDTQPASYVWVSIEGVTGTDLTSEQVLADLHRTELERAADGGCHGCTTTMMGLMRRRPP